VSVLLAFLVLQAAPAEAARSACLARPVVIGASFAAGFGVGRSFASAFEASLAAPPEELVDLGDGAFFLAPVPSGRRQVEAALEAEPSLVLALDFLFWFGYGALDAAGGPLEAESERLTLLEAGLELLVEFRCPLVLGDFPDMSAAVGGMLMGSQMPAQDTLTALSRRVRAWAAERPKTVVLPLAELVRSLGAKSEVRIGRHLFPPGTRLLQADRLHPTLDGLLAAAQLACDELTRAGLTREDDYCLEFATARARLVPPR
jgi:hypothetical protein